MTVSPDPPDRIETARRAQRRVWEVRAASAAPNSPEARRAVNHLVSVLRGLTELDLREFEAWRDREQPSAG